MKKLFVQPLMLYYYPLLALIVCFCTSRYVDREGFYAYVQDEMHGLTKTHRHEDLSVTVSYHPKDLLMAQDPEPPYSIEDMEEASARYVPYTYFRRELISGRRDMLYDSAKRYMDLSKKLQAQLVHWQKYVYLTTSERDTITVVDYHYTRPFGEGKPTSLLFAFRQTEIDSAKDLTIHVDEFGFGAGDLMFSFDKKNLQQVPQLAYKVMPMGL